MSGSPWCSRSASASVSAMTAQEEAAALANDSSDGIPIVVAPAEVQMAVPL